MAIRLRAAIDALGYRHVSQFIADLNINPTTIYAILNSQTRDPGASILKKFYYGGINLNWLIAGEGDMLMPFAQTAGEPGSRRPRHYIPLTESAAIHSKIKDTLDDVMDIYRRLKDLGDYAEALEKLAPEQQEMFHKMARLFFESTGGGEKK